MESRTKIESTTTTPHSDVAQSSIMSMVDTPATLSTSEIQTGTTKAAEETRISDSNELSLQMMMFDGGQDNCLTLPKLIITDILYPDSNVNQEFEDIPSLIKQNCSNTRTLSLTMSRSKKYENLFYVSKPIYIKCQFCNEVMNICFCLLSRGRSNLFEKIMLEVIRPYMENDIVKLAHSTCLEKQRNANEGHNYRFKIEVRDFPVTQWWKSKDGLRSLTILTVKVISLLLLVCLTFYSIVINHDRVSILSLCILLIATSIFSMLGFIWIVYESKKQCAEDLRKWRNNNQNIKLILWKRCTAIA